MEVLILFGLILIIGYFFGLVGEKLSLPRISTYLLAGILFSNELLGRVYPLHLDQWADQIATICLGFIAYIVGGEIHLSKIKSHS